MVYNLLYPLSLLPVFLLLPYLLERSTPEQLAFEPSDGEGVVLFIYLLK